MTDVEDQLHRLLVSRAAEVDPQLTGAGIRDLAGRRRPQRGRTVALPAAGTVLAAALLITPFVLIHHGDSAPRRPAVIVPAGSDTPSSKPPGRTPAPIPSSRPPLVAPTAPAATAPPSPSQSPTPRPSSTGVTAPPAQPTAVPSGSASRSGPVSPGTSALPTPTPTRTR